MKYTIWLMLLSLFPTTIFSQDSQALKVEYYSPHSGILVYKKGEGNSRVLDSTFTYLNLEDSLYIPKLKIIRLKTMTGNLLYKVGPCNCTVNSIYLASYSSSTSSLSKAIEQLKRNETNSGNKNGISLIDRKGNYYSTLILPFDGEVVEKASIAFLWHMEPGDSVEFIINADSMYGKTIILQTTSDSILQITIDSAETNRNYFWTVRPKGFSGKSEMRFFRFIETQNLEKINTGIKEITANDSYNEEMTILFKSAYLESEKQFTDAYIILKKGLKKFPESENLRNYFAEYLRRIKQPELAAKILNNN